MGQPIIQPSRVRRVFNGWSHGCFAGQQFKHVLNLGSGHDQDHEGYCYSGYWDSVTTCNLDISEKTEYGDYQIPVVGAKEFWNPLTTKGNAEQLPITFAGSFDMVFANWMIYQLDWSKVTTEICRVLIPNGKVLITYMDSNKRGVIYNCLLSCFDVISYCYLKMDLELDGRDWVAEGIWGVKK
jgi:SAM-dependent methyltransferase